MFAQDIILKPIITEKSMSAQADKKYTFKVCPMTEIANLAEPGTSIQVYGQWSDVMKVKAKK